MDATKLHIIAITGIIVKNKQVLIVKRDKKEVAFPNMWTLPGGKVERGDSILKTLKKEIKEEVGLEINDEINFSNEYNFIRPDNYSVVGLSFVCKYKSGEIILEQGLNNYKWVDKKNYLQYNLIPGVKKDLKIFFTKDKI
ncbi:NUDIX domain-containing protein [Candidatus Parcubacteria bacterium]|nr:NUDIX domain-containing protein [Candidatus Parcubacteria bacterium]